MVNLFADMGVQPETLQASLVLAQASSDHTSPTAVITSPTGGASVNQGQTVTITGTAADVGGRVAGIEVSTDGGATWHPAAGTTNWSYTWTASGPGTHVIEARATDDSVNLQSSPATLSVNVTGSSAPSLFTASNTPAQTNLNDGPQLEVGVKFQSSVAGQITALKFYRSPSDTGSDLLDLWTATGTKLASATFTNTAASGWQTVSLATPVVDRRQHDLRRVLPHERLLCGDRQFLHHRLHERCADGTLHHHGRRQRRLCLWRKQHHRHLPDQHLQCRQLLGRCGVHQLGGEHRADGGRRHGRCHREGRRSPTARAARPPPAMCWPTTPIPTRATPRPSPRSASARWRHARHGARRGAWQPGARCLGRLHLHRQRDGCRRAGVAAIDRHADRRLQLHHARYGRRHILDDAHGHHSRRQRRAGACGADRQPERDRRLGLLSGAAGRHLHRRRCRRQPRLHGDRRRRLVASRLAELQRRDTHVQRHAGGWQMSARSASRFRPPISAASPPARHSISS